MPNWWTSFWTGLGEAMGFLKQKDAEENAPTQVANKQAEQIQADKAAGAEAVGKPDLTDLRDETAE